MTAEVDPSNTKSGGTKDTPRRSSSKRSGVDTTDPRTSSALYSVCLIVWVLEAIFEWSDWLYAGLACGLAVYVVAQSLAARYVFPTIVTTGSTAAYVIFWAGITVFDDRGGKSLDLGAAGSPLLADLELAALTFVLLVWAFSSEKPDALMGFSKGFEPSHVLRHLWKFAVLWLLALQYDVMSSEKDTLEWLFLLPFVLEVAIRWLIRKKELPHLTLEIWRPFMEHFEVPLSMTRALSIVLIAYLAEWLTHKLWLLVMLMWVLGIFVWFISTITVWSVRTATGFEKQSEAFEGMSLEEKAKAMGELTKGAIRKPHYNVFQIIQAMREEDYTELYMVTKKVNLKLKKGKWRPPIGLLLLPVDLAPYDYRRADEVLLLAMAPRGPVSDKSKVLVTISKDEEGSIEDLDISGSSMVITKEDWERNKKALHAVGEDDDLSAYGYESLADLRESLDSLNKKWQETREKVEIGVLSFIQGVVGSNEALFMPTRPELPAGEPTASRDQAPEQESLSVDSEE